MIRRFLLFLAIAALLFSCIGAKYKYCFKEVEIFYENGDARCVTFSPDGKIFAAGFTDGTVKLWNIQAGRDVLLNTLKFPGIRNWVNSITFSPDGKILVAGCGKGSGNGLLKLWNIETGECIKTLGPNDIKSVIFSPDGKIFATGGCNDGIIKLRSIKTGECIKTLLGNNYWSTIAFSPDGKILASGSWTNIKLWNIETGECIKTLESRYNGNICFVIAFSPDGKILASGSYDHKVKLWKIEGKQSGLIATLGNHNDSIGGVNFSPDGSLLASVSGCSTLKIWDVRSYQCIKEFSTGKMGRCGPNPCVVFHPNGNSVFFSLGDGKVRIIHLDKYTTTREGEAMLSSFRKRVEKVSDEKVKKMIVSLGLSEDESNNLAGRIKNLERSKIDYILRKVLELPLYGSASYQEYHTMSLYQKLYVVLAAAEKEKSKIRCLKEWLYISGKTASNLANINPETLLRK